MSPFILYSDGDGNIFEDVSLYACGRSGWDAVPAVRDGELHEIKSPLILQPGPAALTDGLDAIHHVVRQWSTHH